MIKIVELNSPRKLRSDRNIDIVFFIRNSDGRDDKKYQRYVRIFLRHERFPVFVLLFLLSFIQRSQWWEACKQISGNRQDFLIRVSSVFMRCECECVQSTYIRFMGGKLQLIKSIAQLNTQNAAHITKAPETSRGGERVRQNRPECIFHCWVTLKRVAINSKPFDDEQKKDAAFSFIPSRAESYG